jgi:hypothetical protein
LEIAKSMYDFSSLSTEPHASRPFNLIRLKLYTLVLWGALAAFSKTGIRFSQGNSLHSEQLCRPLSATQFLVGHPLLTVKALPKERFWSLNIDRVVAF